MRSFFLKTLGCKVNSYDSSALANQLKSKGWAEVGSDESGLADVAIINSCSVTHNAEKEARYLARRFKRENPLTKVVVTGCYAQTNSAALADLGEVDFVLPNEVKEQAADLIYQKFDSDADITGDAAEIGSKIPDSVKLVRDNKQSHFKSSLTLFDHAESSRSRVVLKIQDGCNGFCSYCLIPYARGASRSVDPDTVLKEITRQVELGASEIVFTGIHIGDYGRENEESSDDRSTEAPIVALLKKVYALPGSFRIRISSLEPSEVSIPLLEVLRANRSRFSPHFHLPLQSGSDRILKLMRRTYDSKTYIDNVRLIREYFPDANIGADVITGFPSESDEDFAETVKVVESLQMSYVHVFPYSKRPNTAAAKMPGHLDPKVIKSRSATLRLLSAKLTQRYYEKFIGTSSTVIWDEGVGSDGRRSGYTEHYIRVRSRALAAAADEVLDAQTTALRPREDVRILGLLQHDCALVASS